MASHAEKGADVDLKGLRSEVETGTARLTAESANHLAPEDAECARFFGLGSSFQ